MTARETSKKALYASTALTVLLSLQINTTIAQEADNEIAVDNRNTTDVVVVTARKREELLQETPQVPMVQPDREEILYSFPQPQFLVHQLLKPHGQSYLTG